MILPGTIREIARIALQPVTARPLYSPAAVELLLMIAAHESNCGQYLRQLRDGPALGLCQVEPDTMDDNYESYLVNRPELAAELAAISGCAHADLEHLQYNHIYNLQHARLKLWRATTEKMPVFGDLIALSHYAKDYYNTAAGAASSIKYLTAYHQLVLGA